MRRLTTWEQLQTLIGRDSEGADLDFKEKFDVAKAGNDIEAAKDVAALANVLGGHVVIGASTELGGTRCKGFHGIDRASATVIAKHFEEQVKNRCRPSPMIAVRSFDIPNSQSVVTVIAVEPSAIALVGVNVKQPNASKLADEAWIFPHRVGSLTPYLHPDQFGGYESMSARRSAALLRSIPEDQKPMVILRWSEEQITGARANHYGKHEAIFVDVDLRENAAKFKSRSGQASIVVPLDDIASVWRADQWQVSLRGVLRNANGGNQWDYVAGR